MTAGYYRFPTIHADRVVFTCEDDLWTVSAQGGVARRLTANLGEVSRPRFSPDGAWLAFTGREEGQPEAYVMPSEGGQAQRLTYFGHPMTTVTGWDQQGRVIVATPANHWHGWFAELYAVDPQGLHVQPLNLGFAHAISFGPQGGVVIGRHTQEPARWKRYRGGTAGKLWIDPDGSGEFHQLLSLKSNYTSPLWIGDRIYFISDHEGIGNIYSCSPAGEYLQRHTDHEAFYARNLNTDGQRIVYHAGADLYLLDLQTQENRPIPVELHSPQVQRNRKFAPAAKHLESFALHPNGQSAAITTRGKLFSFGTWEGAVTQAGALPGTRYRLPAWLNDGVRLVALSDQGGEEQFVILNSAGIGEPETLSGLDIGRPVALAVHPKEDVIAFSNHRYELFILHLDSRELYLVDQGKADRIGGFAWSPDGEWLAYSVSISLSVSIIKLWHAATGESTPATQPVLRDIAPAFDPEGKYLYFLSHRHFDPVYDSLHFDLNFPMGVKPYLITLRKDLPSPFVPLPKPLVEPKKDNAKEPNGKPSHDDHAEPRKLLIDLEGIEKRTVAFPVEEGIYGRVMGGKNGKIFYSRYPVEGVLGQEKEPHEGPPARGALFFYNLEDQHEEWVASRITDFYLTSSGEALVYRSGEHVRVLKADQKPENGGGPSRKTGWVDLERVKLSISPPAEWSQMFREAWRLQRDQFWTPDMSQVDWVAVYDRYLPLLDRIASRAEFSDLLWEMQGELGTSHAYEGGGDYRPAPNYALGLLGAQYEFDPEHNGWKITHIVQGDSWNEEDSPLNAPGVNVRAGDVIVAIDGQPLSADFTPAMALVNRAGAEVTLTLAPPPITAEETSPPETAAPEVAASAPAEAPDAAQPDGLPDPAADPEGQSAEQTGEAQADSAAPPAPRTVTVKALGSETLARYREWVDNNRQLVHSATQGRVGYVHIPNMMAWGYAEFHRGFLAEYEREGLIIDVRYNGGGHVSPLLLEKLARRRIGYDRTRWNTVLEPYPPDSAAGPLVALTNESAGSDGDIFSHGFKLLKLGPLVGTRTWGGVVGIWPRHPLADGGLTTQPEFSFWFEDVGWGVENYGTDPDIEVENKPQDYRRGEDVQLQRAIEEALKRIALHTPRYPDFDNRPSRALPKLPPR